MDRVKNRVTLYRDVPFDDTYKHVVKWDNQQQLEEYLNGFYSIDTDTNMSYTNLNAPIRWKLYDGLAPSNNTMNDLVNFNYLRIDSCDPNGVERIYYAFITDIVYVNNGMAKIFYSIDVWNTYNQLLDLGKAQIKRCHMREWNLKDPTKLNFSDFFLKYSKNINEDIGGDGCAKLISASTTQFADYYNKPDGNARGQLPDGTIKFVVYTNQPHNVEADLGTLAGSYSQYRFYMFAYIRDSHVLCPIYFGDKKITDYGGAKTVDELMPKLAKDKNFLGSSSLVVDAEEYSYIGIPYTFNFQGNQIRFNHTDRLKMKEDSNLCYIEQVDTNSVQPLSGYVTKFKNNNNVLATLYYMLTQLYGDRIEQITGLKGYIPMKIIGQPFIKFYFTNGRGTSKTLDPLQFSDLNMDDIELYKFSGIGPNGHEQYTVRGYNIRLNDYDMKLFGNRLFNYENTLMVDDSPRDVPVVLDSWTEFMNNNKNQLQATRANAKMNENLAKWGNANQLANTTNTLSTAAGVQRYTAGRKQAMAGIQGALSGASSGASAGAMGGPEGALIGAGVGALAGGLINSAMTGYNNQTAINAGDMTRAAQQQNADRNYAFNNAVATNNYEQTIRNQNAMLADYANHNSELAHQGSNYLQDVQNDNDAMYMQIFVCQDNVMLNAMLYFYLFGYNVSLYTNIEDVINSHIYFNYVQASDVHVHGEKDKKNLKGVNPQVESTINDMLQSGVTFWNPRALNVNGQDKFYERDITGNGASGDLVI